MRITPWLVAAILVFALWRAYTHRAIEHHPGMVAAAAPLQRVGGGPGIERGEYLLRPRADFSATVRILHREDYTFDGLADLVPTDFAVGWGPMSDSAVLADVEIRQGNRFYFWRTKRWPIERSDIETHSANWHVIPGSAGVRAVLDRLRVGSVVEFRGKLVDIEGAKARRTTSLTREDTGDGACEILLVTSARIVGVR